MKPVFIFLLLLSVSISPLAAQSTNTGYSLDMMLINGQYDKVIDTCRVILENGNNNIVVIYKMGIAYEYMMQTDSAISCFTKASELDPDNPAYTFHLAKGYFLKEDFKKAEPLFKELNSADPLRWLYGLYLTNIYMSEKKFQDAIEILLKFSEKNPENCNFLDRIALAYLKDGDFLNAIGYYNMSLSLNQKNPQAVSNLAFLYTSIGDSEKALSILDRAISADSTDTDLSARRGQIYYSRDSVKYYKLGLRDYLRVLKLGDSSFYYLKMAGYGYYRLGEFNNAIKYLKYAYKVDTADYNTNLLLGKSYQEIKIFSNSIYYSKKAIEILDDYQKEYEKSYNIMAKSLENRGLYKQAANGYLQSLGSRFDPDIVLLVANIYDEKLKDRENAIINYQKLFDNISVTKKFYTPDYIARIKSRLDWLKNNPAK